MLLTFSTWKPIKYITIYTDMSESSGEIKWQMKKKSLYLSTTDPTKPLYLK